MIPTNVILCGSIILFTMTFMDIGPFMFGTSADVIQFLRSRNVLARSMLCTK